jgi:drug/metabolite transporter (DMT)-like permease
MTAILGGFGAAMCWTVAMLCSSRASRELGAVPTLAWVMGLGFLIVLPLVIAAGSLPTGSEAIWLFVAGAGNIIGLVCEYTAVRSGKVGVVAAIASTEGAVAAVLSAIAGESISAAVAAVLALVATGIVLASLEESGAEVADRWATKAVVLAFGAALSFGISLYAVGHVSGDVEFAWLVLPARLVGVAVITLPLAVRGGLLIPKRTTPFVLAAGVAEVLGVASFAWGARDSISVTSVLGSQFAAISAVGAFFFFGERLRRVQIVGVAAIVVGVGLLAVLRG